MFVSRSPHGLVHHIHTVTCIECALSPYDNIWQTMQIISNTIYPQCNTVTFLKYIDSLAFVIEIFSSSGHSGDNAYLPAIASAYISVMLPILCHSLKTKNGNNMTAR